MQRRSLRKNGLQLRPLVAVLLPLKARKRTLPAAGTHIARIMLAATLLLLGLLAAGGGSASSSQPQAPPEGETWAVIVSSSRYWFNYRHTANALAVYRSLRDLVGVPDDRIILMLADDHACAARNRFSGFVYHFDDDHTPASTV